MKYKDEFSFADIVGWVFWLVGLLSLWFMAIKTNTVPSNTKVLASGRKINEMKNKKKNKKHKTKKNKNREMTCSMSNYNHGDDYYWFLRFALTWL